MNKITLNVEQRYETGKGPARRLRAVAKAPAIFYGKKVEPINLAIDVHEFVTKMDKAGHNPLFDLRIKTEAGEVSKTALLKARQTRPVDGKVLHLDFVQVFMDEAIEVVTPIEFVGKPIGVEKGGMFQPAAREIRVSCLPNNIPDVIVVDISNIEMGHSIHVGEIALPEGVKASTDASVALASVLAPKKEEAGAAEAEEVAEEVK
ncbi:MAG: 50S ribosomal protein L25 [Desulfomonilaceae bacterium]